MFIKGFCARWGVDMFPLKMGLKFVPTLHLGGLDLVHSLWVFSLGVYIPNITQEMASLVSILILVTYNYTNKL